MKLRNLLFCLCSIVTLTSSAIEPVAQLFIAMPDSLVPSIEVNRRKDLIDLMHAGQKAEMTLLQDSLLSIDLSKRSKMEIRWYDTTGNDTIIAFVNTVYAPAGDSRIRFFDTAWKELPASERIRQIRREEFFQFPDSLTKAKKEDLLRPVDIFLVEYNFATDGSLCARQSWANYLDKELFNRIEPYLQDSIILHWDGKRFK